MTELYIAGEDREAFPESSFSVGEGRQVDEVALQFNVSSMPAVNCTLNTACSRTKHDNHLFCKPYCIDPVTAVCIHTCSDPIRHILLKGTFLKDISMQEEGMKKT